MSKLVQQFCLILMLLLVPSMVEAQSLIPMGHTIEVTLQYEHIVVSEPHQLFAGQQIERGDLLMAIDGKETKELAQVPKQINSEKKLQLTNKTNSFSVTIKPAEWARFYASLKDATDGIGTMTYIESGKNQFGALGHAIEDQRVPTMPNIVSGQIFLTKIHTIHKSEKGIPGYKVTKSDSLPVGQVSSNTIVGVFGKWQSGNELRLAKPIEIIQEKEIKTGEASVLTQVEDETISTFSIEITSVSNDNILFEVTDERLLAVTGGIVQGMSGSPIIQDGKFVGAITHMFVENPKKGAAIWIGKMIENS